MGFPQLRDPTFFSEGTSVGCLSAAVHLDEHVVGADTRPYRPER